MPACLMVERHHNDTIGIVPVPNKPCALCAFCVIQRFLRKKALFAHLQCLRVIMNVEGLLAHVPKWPNDYP